MNVKTILALAGTANSIGFCHDNVSEVVGIQDLAILLRFIKTYELVLKFDLYVIKVMVHNDAVSTHLLEYPSK